jgi:hypothetical protein
MRNCNKLDSQQNSAMDLRFIGKIILSIGLITGCGAEPPSTEPEIREYSAQPEIIAPPRLEPATRSSQLEDTSSSSNSWAPTKSTPELQFDTESITKAADGVGTGHALLIGIDTYSKSPLSSCVADAMAMKRLLVDVYKFPEENVHLLTNNDANKTGIFRAIQEELIQKVSTEDQVVFYFSGHGTQVHDFNGDEEDNMDEALCPVNIFDASPVQADQYITDDELGELLGQVRNKAAKLTAIIDSCHSGTGTRALFNNDGPALPTKFLNIGYVEPPSMTKDVGGVARQRNVLDGITTLFACQPNQKAVGGQPGELSVFTRNVIEALTKRPDFSAESLIASIAPEVVESSGYWKQKPGADAPLAGPAINPPGVKITVSPGGFQRADSSPTLPPKPSDPDESMLTANQKKKTYGELVAKKDFAVWVSTDKMAYCKNDLMKLSVKSARDCYIRIYLINAEGDTQQIFPNAYQSENWVKQGESVTMPPVNGAFQFRMTEPFGLETIKVVASSEQFSDLKNLQFGSGEIFRSYNDLTPSTAGTKGISVEAATPKPTPAPPAGGSPTPSQKKALVAEAAIRYVVSDCP